MCMHEFNYYLIFPATCPLLHLLMQQEHPEVHKIAEAFLYHSKLQLFHQIGDSIPHLQETVSVGFPDCTYLQSSFHWIGFRLQLAF